jgi:DNA-binding protein
MYISQGTVKKILKEAGAQRISMEASEEMRKYLNKLAFRTAQKAVKLSKHARRKTVELSDIRLALD